MGPIAPAASTIRSDPGENNHPHKPKSMDREHWVGSCWRGCKSSARVKWRRQEHTCLSVETSNASRPHWASWAHDARGPLSSGDRLSRTSRRTHWASVALHPIHTRPSLGSLRPHETLQSRPALCPPVWKDKQTRASQKQGQKWRLGQARSKVKNGV